MGAKVTFDSEERLIIVTAAPVGGIVTLDVQVDLYSDMKEDIRASAVLAGNPPAFLNSQGGVPTATGYTGQYYFINNVEGWRIQPYDADHELYLVGNVFPIDSAASWWVARSGRTIVVSREFSNLAAGVALEGDTGWTLTEQAQIRDALGVGGSKVTAVGGQLQTIDGKIDTVDGVVDTIDGKVDANAVAIAAVKTDTEALLARLTLSRAAALDNLDGMNTNLILLKKIAVNKLELEDGDSGNWVLYDDDDVTPLLTWDVLSKTGGPISLQGTVPARRSRGV